MTERRVGIIGKAYGRSLSSSSTQVKNKELKLAVEQRRVKDVKLLVEEMGVDPNQKVHGMTHLNRAVYTNSLDIIRILLDHEANVNEHSFCADTEEGEHEYPIVTTARLCRSQSRQTDILKLLISHGADVNKTDYASLSPLYYAVHSQNSVAVELLLTSEANVNMRQGGDGKTVVYEAVVKSNLGILELLVNYGAKVDIVDNDGLSPLHIVNDNGLDVAKYLIDRGLPINPLTHAGVTPLQSALQRLQFNAARLLLAHGGNPNLFSLHSVQSTPLGLAVEHGRFDIAELIADVGCNFRREHAHVGDSRLRRLSENETFNKILNDHVFNPISLKGLCRMVVRSYLSQHSGGRSILKHVEKLPLPKLIMDYLSLN